MGTEISIAEKIRLIRVNLHWSQSQLGDHLGKQASTICKYENGTVIPPGDILDRIYELKSKIKNVSIEF